MALIRQQGLQAQYHNHAKEYLNRCDDGYRMDYIMEHSDPALLPLCEQVVQPLWYTADHDKAYDGDVFGELGMSLEFIRNTLRYCQ